MHVWTSHACLLCTGASHVHNARDSLCFSKASSGILATTDTMVSNTSLSGVHCVVHAGYPFDNVNRNFQRLNLPEGFQFSFLLLAPAEEACCEVPPLLHPFSD